jgi:Ca-activated chloride channel family protein
VTDSGKRFSQTDRDFKFAASVAAFGMLLRNSPHRGQAAFVGAAKWAADGAKGDDFGYRNEFLELVTKARQLRGE